MCYDNINHPGPKKGWPRPAFKTYLSMSFSYLILAIIPIINLFFIIYLMIINPKKPPNTNDYRNIRKE